MSGRRSFDFGAMTGPDCYRLMASSIVPRPIAWVVTQALDGTRNAAPYSFFNMMGSEPPIVAIGVLAGATGVKDTAANIAETNEFVVHLVSEQLAEQMNSTSASLAPEADELALAGIETVAATVVRPPVIAAAPVAFECRALNMIEAGPRQFVIIGQVLMAHFDKAILTDEDGARPRVRTEDIGLIARMHGTDMYARTTDLFSMQRPA